MMYIERVDVHVYNFQDKIVTMKVERVAVVVFSRFPRPGSTKTRLTPLLGEAGAARAQLIMVSYIFLLSN